MSQRGEGRKATEKTGGKASKIKCLYVTILPLNIETFSTSFPFSFTWRQEWIQQSEQITKKHH